MRLSSRTASHLIHFPTLIAAVSVDCSHVRVDGQSFDLSDLDGPHSVHDIKSTPPSLSNTTYTIDICKPLKKIPKVLPENQCPSGTRVCGIEYDYNLAEGTHIVREVRPIAGDYIHDSRPLDPKWTRLKNSDSHADADKEGLRLEMNGGRFPFKGTDGQQQKAFIEFICDPDRTGLEGDDPHSVPEEDGDGKHDDDDEKGEEGLRQRGNSVSAEDDSGDGEKGEGKSLNFVSYKTEGENDVGVLRLQWRTKYACEGRTDHDSTSKKSGHWGVFTWFIIIMFLATATYLIFGSWLNYHKYGARGWDLLPHGDTIRDVPYLLKDWARRVVSTVQGGGSRGGYSAV